MFTRDTVSSDLFNIHKPNIPRVLRSQAALKTVAPHFGLICSNTYRPLREIKILLFIGWMSTHQREGDRTEARTKSHIWIIPLISDPLNLLTALDKPRHVST